MKVYVTIETQDQMGTFRGVEVFDSEEKAESYIRNRHAFIKEVEVK